MKKKRLMLFIMLNLLLVGIHAQADGDSVAFNRMIAMMKHIKVFQMTYPQEKVYMHFDNTGYFKGERMYFKAYVTRTDRGLPTDISKVLYVDLLNPSGDVIHKSKLRLEKGEAHGDIAIDSIIGTGFYEVRAYTRYMLNFGDETCFSRVIPIFNKPEKNGDYSNPVIDHLAYYQRLPERELPDDSIATLNPVEQKRRKGGGYQVNVYPEGGKMVKGLMSRVAFTVLDKNHLPVALMGEVVDADGNTLNIVASGKDGRGIFDLVPTTEKMTMILSLRRSDIRKVCICNLVLMPFALAIAVLFGGPMLKPWMLLTVTIVAAVLVIHNTWKLKKMELGGRRSDSFPE